MPAASAVSEVSSGAGVQGVREGGQRDARWGRWMNYADARRCSADWGICQDTRYRTQSAPNGKMATPSHLAGHRNLEGGPFPPR